MKKIMKKALSLVLALVMVFALVPMTAKAEVGDVTTLQDSVTVELEAYEAHQFEYTPTEWGYITFTIEEATGWYINFYGGDGQAYLDNYESTTVKEITYDVIPGQTCTVTMLTQNADGSSYAAGSLTYSITFTEEAAPVAGTASNPIALTGESSNVTVKSGEQVYYTVAPSIANTYTLTVSGTGNFGLVVPGMRGGVQTIQPTNGKATYNFDVDPRYGMPDFTFSISNASDADLTLNVAYAVAVGTYNNPVELTTLGNAVAPTNGDSYWYKWTATEDGTFIISISQEDFASYAGAQVYMITTADGYDYPDMPSTNVQSVVVAEGDELLIQCSSGNATLNFKTEFTDEIVEDSGNNNNGDNDNNGPTIGVITPGEGDANFAESTAPIVAGNNKLTVSNDYAYTVFKFEPTTEGAYTLKSEDSLLGIVGYHWTDANLVNAENVSTGTIEWECTGVGQAIYVAVMANTNEANINVTWEKVEKEEIPSDNACVSVSIDTYTFKGENLQSFMYAYADGELEYAVDEHGYFHVVSPDDIVDYEYVGETPIEELPYVLVKLNDSVVSLQSAIGYGSVKWVSYTSDEEGKLHAQYILYFNDMIEDYLECAATDEKLYPLTWDLLDLMHLVGEDQGWYEEGGVVQAAYANDQLDAEYLPYFAMYYLNQEVTTLDKEDVKVSKEEIADLIVTNKDKEVVINTPATNEAGEAVEVTFTFAPGAMKVEGEVNFDVKVVETFDKAGLADVEIKKETFALKVNFAHTGKLPGEATIYIPVPEKFVNTTLYYYQVMEDGTLKFVCSAPVDALGNAKVTQDHCSDYVLLTEKIAEKTSETTPTTPSTPEVPKTGDAANFVLWFSVLALGVVAIVGSVVMKKREF